MKLIGLAASVGLLAWALLLPNVARAGGWAVVSLDQVPIDVVAGEEFSVAFRVLRHGQSSMDHTLKGLEAHIEAIHRESGRRITFPSPSAGKPGYHVAAITLPEAGTWDWAVVAFDGPHTMYPLKVSVENRSTGSAPGAEGASSAGFWRWLAMGSGIGAGVTLLAAAGVAAGMPGRRLGRNI